MAFDWDDLRIFVAAARAGSLTGAAQAVGVDAATVGRRVARLETALKSTLIVRSPTGLQLTAAGARMMELGLDAEAVMTTAAGANEQEIAGGTVRLSAAEGFGSEIIAPSLPGLRASRPGLRLELAAYAGFLSPTRREVDMAITLNAPSAARLVVEPLTDYQLGLYAAPAYLDRAGRPADVAALGRFDLIGYVDDLIYSPELRYLDEIGTGLRPVLSSSSIRAQREMVLAGGGIGVLPCFLAQGLERVLSEQILLTRRFWLSTHHDVADSARIRATRAWIQDLVGQKRGRLAPYPALSA
jgi:DNA-binding transcriptional LysR family regulator